MCDPSLPSSLIPIFALSEKGIFIYCYKKQLSPLFEKKTAGLALLKILNSSELSSSTSDVFTLVKRAEILF